MVHAVIEDSYISQQEEDKQLCITESVVYTHNQQKLQSKLER